MKGNKESKTEKKMSVSEIQKRIQEKKDKLFGLHASFSIYGMTDLTHEQKAKGREIEDRLFYRTLVAEEELLDDKIQLYGDLLQVLRKR